MSGAHCSDTAVAQITEPQELTVAVDSLSNPACNGDRGFIRLQTEGGTAPVVATWTHQVGLDTLVLADLDPGTYEVRLVDVNGCQVADSITLTEPDSVELTIVATDPRCAFEASGAVRTQVNGGVAPYMFTWSGGYLARFI